MPLMRVARKSRDEPEARAAVTVELPHSEHRQAGGEKGAVYAQPMRN